jgi:hypothetical protein
MHSLKRSIFLLSAATAATAAISLACTPEQLLSLATGAGLQLLGISPTADFNRTGRIRLQTTAPAGSQQKSIGLPSFLKVKVANQDGTYTDCTPQDQVTERPSRFNSVAVLLDDSGSMERSYPASQYGDLCITCPHDPDRARVSATRTLLERIEARVPSSRVGLFDFGTDQLHAFQDANALMDFSPGNGQLDQALNRVDGSREYGTPLWDALAETITRTAGDANGYQDAMAAHFGLCEHDDQTDDFDLGDDFDDNTDDLGSADDDAHLPILPTVDDGSGLDADGGGGMTVDPTVPEPPTIDELAVKRVVVVLSDGEDTLSDEHDLASVAQLANSQDVTVHVIGLGRASVEQALMQTTVDADQSQALRDLQRLAEETGGIYASVADPAALEALFAKLADSLAEGYEASTYTCAPSDAEPGHVADSGDEVRGIVQLGQVQLPWRILAP